MKKVLLITATPSNYDDFYADEDMGKSIHKLSIVYPRQQFEHSVRFNNKEGLAKVYNTVLKDKTNKDYIILFAHDDVALEDAFLVEKLNEAMTKFDVVGLAGTQGPIEVKEPAAWHLMCPDRQKMSGAVAHITNNQESADGWQTSWMTAFGPMPKRVVLIDGLFMAVNAEKVIDKDVLFDEIFKFHHYDLDFSLTCNKNGLKIGTWPIWVTHRGLGNSMLTPEWAASQQQFIKKWGS